jgi:tetratricopeptide (TPR) repeat protein
MLENTGTVSFLFYGVFIVITIVAMVVAFKQIIKGTIAIEKLDKMIELFKYAIVSTAIATVTLVVTNLFKEREQDVKELEYFDKYVGDVKKADGIQERLQLSKYLSIVASNGNLKESWTSYYDSVKVEHEEYLKDLKIKKALDALEHPTDKQIADGIKVEEKIDRANSPLSAADNNTSQELKSVKLTADDFEKLGFENLRDKNYEKAKENFKSSYEIYPTLHNVYEITRLLDKINPTDNNSWNQIYSIILKNYSWGIPADIRTDFVKETSSNKK